MADCVCLPKCPFFNDKMSNMPAMAEMYKTKYCLSDNSDCARYMVFRKMGSDAVPTDMYPNDRDSATTLLAENGF